MDKFFSNDNKEVGEYVNKIQLNRSREKLKIKNKGYCEFSHGRHAFYEV